MWFQVIQTDGLQIVRILLSYALKLLCHFTTSIAPGLSMKVTRKTDDQSLSTLQLIGSVCNMNFVEGMSLSSKSFLK